MRADERSNLPPRYYRGNYAVTLRGFYYVARLSSITRAAVELGLDESTVSLQIMALERDLGVRLLNRQGRKGVSLTPDGQVLLGLATPIVTGLEGIKDQFDSYLQKKPVGQVSMACSHIVLRFIMPEILRDWMEQYPEIKITAVERAMQATIAGIQDGTYSLAFAHITRVPDDINYFECMRTDLYIMTPLDHPLLSCPRVLLKDVARYGFLFSSRSIPTYQVVKATLQLHGYEFRVVADEVGGFDAVARCVELGLGIGVMPELYARDRAHGSRLGVIPAQHLFGTRTYGILYSSTRPLSMATRVLIQHLLSKRPFIAESATS